MPHAAMPVPRPRRIAWRRALLLVGTILLIAGCAVFMLFQLGQNLGVEALIVGLIAAIVPVPVLVACFLWLDRYEPEPVKYLIFCFAWGAFVSTAASLAVNTLAAGRFEEWGLSEGLVAVLVAPFIEELTKALGPILLLLLRRREFSGITDGIVYCGMSALGFAMVENILYLGGHSYARGIEEYGRATGLTLLFGTFLLRILLSGFAHPLFTSMVGVGLGIAARTADRRVRVMAALTGLLLAMMLHGTWNFTPTITAATGQPLILLYGYFAVMVPIFLGMVGLALWLRSWEGRLTERRLPDYVRAGWLSPPEVAALGSLGRRHAARQWARRVAGEAGLRAMRSYQFAAVRLALLRDGLVRGLDRKPADRARIAQEELQLLNEIAACRAVFAGRDPQVPQALWDGSRYHVTFPDGVRRTLDAPDEPVVPIPVVLAAQPMAAQPPGPPPVPGPHGWYPGPAR
jgi:RsiW-degrading membrane proteinase PrsW (M82 family)